LRRSVFTFAFLSYGTINVNENKWSKGQPGPPEERVTNQPMFQITQITVYDFLQKKALGRVS
jgi:hypothetical protein